MEIRTDTGHLVDAVKRLQLSIRVAGDDALSARDLTFTHASVLVALAASGPLPCSSLARRLGITRQSMQQLVGMLHDGGLLTKRSDPRDARHIVVDLSSVGKVAAGEADAILRNIETRMAAGLSLDDRRRLLSWLGTCIDNLDRSTAA